jgi:uncharacterized protein (TIGR00304 family)
VNVPGVAAAALWLAGITLVVLSVLRGDATVSLIVIIPVVTGSSATFVGGVGLIIAGFVALLFAFSAPWSSEEAPLRPHQRGLPSGEPEGGAGGFVLIGPVPIMFGSWRGISRRDRWWLGLIGATILIVVVLATLWLVR